MLCTVFVSAQAANRVYDFVNGPVEELQANQSESKTTKIKLSKLKVTKTPDFLPLRKHAYSNILKN